jgi:translation initiation factor IF-2
LAAPPSVAAPASVQAPPLSARKVEPPSAPAAAPPAAAPTKKQADAHPPAKSSEAPAAKGHETTIGPRAPEVTSARPPDAAASAADLSGKTPTPAVAGAKVPDLNQASRPESRARRQPREIRPTMARAVPPPQLKKPLQREVKKPAEPQVQKPLQKFTPEMLQKGIVNPQDLLKPAVPEPLVPVFEDEEEGGEDRKGKGSKAKPGLPGREKRHQQRQERAKQRKGRGSEVEVLGGKILVAEDEDRPRHLKDRTRKLHKPRPITEKRKGKVPVDFPITVRALSEAIGVKWGDVVFRLLSAGAPPTTNINSTVDPQLAEVMALDAGCELEIRKKHESEDQVLARLGTADKPEDLVPRAPIVTIMGHVDHGKTSLLDKIRASNVVATEAGGITQVIRAWRVEHGGRPITFLDTPGHEAFTKMRARGAQVTDIAVIVVAADDGVMPQTEEAISHAKAAGVPIVVAINKVDLPNANINKTRQQLYSLQLIPDTMGGDTPFVETSAATGKGIAELLDMLSLVAETMLELKGNPTKPAQGTCLEAMLSEGEGVRATLLVRDGTLRRGDVILCGATFGHVRQMYDDLGRPIQEAGPSMPVRITGLDEVPNADDPFVVVPDLAMARDIAEKRKARLREAAMQKRTPVTLENLSDLKIAELKVILKADFRGSIEAIRKEMDKLHHEEVRIRILHAAIGAITESDVQLALTSPEDTLIVGFNVVPDDRAQALAEEKGVQVRQYDIIYRLTEDIRAALEGKLKPREEVVHLGRAVIRETFKISRVGTIAGCYVTQGVIERSAKVRLIREGVVIYPPAERTASLDSLKRFKEDVREVREGFECGLKIAGYDDIKVGDVVEAYRIEQVQRTL